MEKLEYTLQSILHYLDIFHIQFSRHFINKFLICKDKIKIHSKITYIHYNNTPRKITI